jgi:hypothetical protein
MAHDFRLAFQRVRSRVDEQRWLSMTILEVAEEIHRELRALESEPTDGQVEQTRSGN